MAVKAIICDIDGTVAVRVPFGRKPFDWHRVGEDLPNEPVIHVLQALNYYGHPVVFVSGRMEQCREATEKWIDVHIGIRHEGLFMRADKDNRSDTTVKLELYRRHIEPNFEVQLVLDDRNSVVKMWRELGLTCLQVAEGDF